MKGREGVGGLEVFLGWEQRGGGKGWIWGQRGQTDLIHIFKTSLSLFSPWTFATKRGGVYPFVIKQPSRRCAKCFPLPPAGYPITAAPQ